MCQYGWYISEDVELIAPHVPFIIAFIGFVGVDDDHTDSNVAIAAGLLGCVCGSIWYLCVCCV